MMNIFKSSLAVALLGMASLGHAMEKGGSFLLRGNIIGKAPQQVILTYMYRDTNISDTATVKNGQFEFKGTIEEPTMANLNLFGDLIWLEPTTMNISIDVEKSKHSMTGSETQADQEAYYATIDLIINSLRPMAMRYQQLADSLPKIKDSQVKGTVEKQMIQLKKHLDQASNVNKGIQKTFITKHPNSFFSAFLLYPINAGEAMPIDSCITLYDGLSPYVQQGYWGKKIKKDMTIISNNRAGRPAPNFTAYDPIHRANVSLSDLKGKVVVLDFWAPWCSPCRWGFKHLKELYRDYHDKGLEIVAVYADRKENQAKWKEAIDKDGVADWHHVKIAENMEMGKETPEDIRSLYYVQAIPRKILIDRQGNIAKIWVGVSKGIEDEVEKMIKVELSK